MKKIIIGLLFSLVVVSACKKEEKKKEDTPKTKEELLCQMWDIETYTLDGFGFAWLPRLYHWKFKSDGTVEWYKVETGNYYRSTSWAWAEDKEALDIELIVDKSFRSESIIARVKIHILTEREMILEPGNSDHKLEMSFKR